jgi:outer membrane protein
MLRRWLACATLAAATFTPVAAVAAPAAVPSVDRIAVVDVQRCILETREGKTARTELEKVFTKSQAKLETKAKALQRDMQDLGSKSSMLSAAELGKRQEQLMRRQAELAQLQESLQNDVVEREALLTEEIYRKVAAVVQQLALEESVQVVLVRSEMTVLYANPKLDLTNRVIVAYDAKHK